MIRLFFFVSILSISLLACTPEQNPSDLQSLTIALEVNNSQVLLVNDREIHIDYLDAVLSNFKSEYNLTASLVINSDAQMGTVIDVQKKLHHIGINILSNEG